MSLVDGLAHAASPSWLQRLELRTGMKPIRAEAPMGGPARPRGCRRPGRLRPPVSMRISTEWVTTVCAVCDRTLLQGERSRRLRRAPGEEPVDVCALCERSALEHGWVREGAPLLALATPQRRRQRQRLPSLAAIFLGAGGLGDGGASLGGRRAGRGCCVRLAPPT